MGKKPKEIENEGVEHSIYTTSAAPLRIRVRPLHLQGGISCTRGVCTYTNVVKWNDFFGFWLTLSQRVALQGRLYSIQHRMYAGRKVVFFHTGCPPVQYPLSAQVVVHVQSAGTNSTARPTAALSSAQCRRLLWRLIEKHVVASELPHGLKIRIRMRTIYHLCQKRRKCSKSQNDQGSRGNEEVVKGGFMEALRRRCSLQQSSGKLWVQGQEPLCCEQKGKHIWDLTNQTMPTNGEKTPNVDSTPT